MKTYWTHMCPDLVLSFVFLLLLLLFHFLLNHLFIQGHQWPQGGKKPHSFVKLTLVYLFPHLSSAFLHHPSLVLLG